MAMIYTALKIAPMTVTMPLSLRYPPQVTGFSVHFYLFILDYLLKSFVSIKETAFYFIGFRNYSAFFFSRACWAFKTFA